MKKIYEDNNIITINQLSFKDLKQAFVEKYPQGDMFIMDTKGNHRVQITYDVKNCKCYNYSKVNYLQLANRLNLFDNKTVMYHKHYLSALKRINDLEQLIANDYISSGIFGDFKKDKEETDNELSELKNKLFL